MSILGYTVPLHRSLTRRILLAGAPRQASILVGTVAAAIGLGLQVWWAGIAIWVIGQGVIVYLARRDPDFFAVYRRSLKHRTFLDV